LGAFLIPIGVSSLRGLTHVVTCREATNVPFNVSLPPEGDPTVSSAVTFTRDQETALCGGLHVDMRVGRVDADTLRIVLPIQNGTKHTWQGTVKLNVGSTGVPVRIGKVPAGATREQTVNFNVDRGVHDISGALLIGP
jgi:hypothetical protein